MEKAKQRYERFIILLEKNAPPELNSLVIKFRKYSLEQFLAILRYEFNYDSSPVDVVLRFLSFVDVSPEYLNQIDDEVTDTIHLYISYFLEVCNIM